jgi:proteasome lid subunit RPN8/RPN11
LSLSIRKSEYDAIRRQAEQAYPNECCGVLTGTIAAGERRVHATISCSNIRVDSARTRFEIDPAELVRVQREARKSGMEIVGFYHSHPDHPAQPSPTDLEHAHWIGCSYVITSVEHGNASETRSFFLSGTREEYKCFLHEPVGFF